MYNMFTDPADLKTATAMTDNALCGFNMGTSAYCNARQGDSYYTGYTKMAKETYAKSFVCNPASSSVEPYCEDFSTNGGSHLHNKFRAAQFLVAANGNADVADNDDCVKTMITANYWNYGS
jgi:hypothetical protein